LVKQLSLFASCPIDAILIDDQTPPNQHASLEINARLAQALTTGHMRQGRLAGRRCLNSRP